MSGFKGFLLQGNGVDLAVAVVIGVAFTIVITGLVEDLITPIIGALGGLPDFLEWVFTVNGKVLDRPFHQRTHFFHGDRGCRIFPRGAPRTKVDGPVQARDHREAREDYDFRNCDNLINVLGSTNWKTYFSEPVVVRLQTDCAGWIGFKEAEGGLSYDHKQ